MVLIYANAMTKAARFKEFISKPLRQGKRVPKALCYDFVSGSDRCLYGLVLGNVVELETTLWP